VPDTGAASGAPDRRSSGSSIVSRRAAVGRHLARHHLSEFGDALASLAVAVFGPQATVVAHLRRIRDADRLTFVVDAATPSATVDYASFLPYEQAFWTAYAQLPKPPEERFIVAIRPARGWSRSEALAPFFAYMRPPDEVT
jgi:hypothetical protein